MPGKLLVRQQVAAMRTAEGDDRDPPGPLPRDTPVGAVRDHSADWVLAPRGNPSDLFDLRQGLGAQSGLPAALIRQDSGVHRDEPLLRRPEDRRMFAPPAMGIGVFDAYLRQQQAAALKLRNDHAVRLPDA